jgi:outer membrane lipoprotein SlyB
MMLIAAITVIVFSVAGIATMMGWLPGAQSQIRLQSNEPPVRRAAADNSRAIAPATAAACVEDCGVVESIRAVEVKGEGSGLGAVGGAVVDAGAGVYAGHQIEKNTRKSVSYQIRVRMNDGTSRTFLERAQPALAIGQKVRVTGQSVNAAG